MRPELWRASGRNASAGRTASPPPPDSNINITIYIISNIFIDTAPRPSKPQALLSCFHGGGTKRNPTDTNSTRASASSL